MITNSRIFMVIGLASWFNHGSSAFKYNNDGYTQSKQKQPVILMHKQALSENGAFNFAFAGDNGIKQGETINPDGTRTGAYSYIDPNGETISVKYTAGKDGFKILQGDHIPKASVIQPAIYGAASASSAKYSPMYSEASSQEVVDDFGFAPSSTNSVGAIGSYPHHGNKINPALYRVREESSAEYFPTQFVPVTYNNPPKVPVQDQSNEYEGPHSFGKGYAFEFGNAANQ